MRHFFPTAHLGPRPLSRPSPSPTFLRSHSPRLFNPTHSFYRNPFLLDFEAIDAQEIQTKSAAIFFQDAKKC